MPQRVGAGASAAAFAFGTGSFPAFHTASRKNWVDGEVQLPAAQPGTAAEGAALGPCHRPGDVGTGSVFLSCCLSSAEITL